MPDGFGEPQRSLLLAKAHRHLGVIRTIQERTLNRADFDRAQELLTAVQDRAPKDVRVDATHVKYAEALAITTMLG
nr:hypothetical protein [Micromonospora sp. DSM 115978]